MNTKFWEISEWLSSQGLRPPKGSRRNTIVENPETKEVYYFKESADKFPSEIWSEIIASKIGQVAGFQVLNYDIALKNGTLGCLSKSMIQIQESESLYHGVDVLSDYVEDFEVSEKPVYSFQDLVTICSKSQFKTSLPNFLEMIIFDSLIGNQDRHTENWAFIQKTVAKQVTEESTVYSWFKKKSKKSPFSKPRYKIENEYSFAPIYDNGSCLGREVGDLDIPAFLRDKQRLDAYLNRGASEICWNGQKMKFWDILAILNETYPVEMKKIASRLKSKLTDRAIGEIVEQADAELLGKTTSTLLSSKRKELIQALLTKRRTLLLTCLGLT